jgi:hypothetical protein
MTTLTIGQASKEVGISKPSISRAIKSGRLSAKKNDNGTYSIDPAELFRVYPPKTKVTDVIGEANGKMLQSTTPESISVTSNETIELRAELKSLRNLLNGQEERIQELKEDRDNWRDQAKESIALAKDGQKLLEHSKPKGRGLFGWFSK